MKLLWLVLTVCAFAQGADLNKEILFPGENVESRLANTHLELNLVSENNAVTEDDLLLMSELETLEKQHGRNLVTDAIINMLESARDVIINGNENMGPLDPLVLSPLGPFDVTATGVAITSTINDFRMDGLRWFVVDNISFNVLRLGFEIQITIPWITATGSYDARARIGFISHTAGGNFRVFAHRIEVGVDMRLGTNIFGGHLTLRQLDINIDIHDTQIQIHGLTGSSLINGIINTLVQSVTQDLIQSEMATVSQMLSTELFDVINDILKDFTINDILGM